MSDNTDTIQELDEFSKNPKQASSDAGSVTQQSIPDRIAMDRYMQAKKATVTTSLPFRIFKIQPL